MARTHTRRRRVRVALQLEWWLFDNCHVGWNHNDARMVPDWDCLKEEWGVRLLVAVVVERAGVLIVNSISSASPYHKSTLEEIQRQDAANMAAVQHQMLPGAPEGLVEDLKFLFDRCGVVWWCAAVYRPRRAETWCSVVGAARAFSCDQRWRPLYVAAGLTPTATAC